jgi:hypothetical protein
MDEELAKNQPGAGSRELGMERRDMARLVLFRFQAGN